MYGHKYNVLLLFALPLIRKPPTRSYTGTSPLSFCPNLKEFAGNIDPTNFEIDCFKWNQLVRFEPEILVTRNNHNLSKAFLPTLISHLSYRLTTLIIKNHSDFNDWNTVALLKCNCPFISTLKINVYYSPEIMNVIFTFERLTWLKLCSQKANCKCF
jgi:hypothetical protein